MDVNVAYKWQANNLSCQRGSSQSYALGVCVWAKQAALEQKGKHKAIISMTLLPACVQVTDPQEVATVMNVIGNKM